VRKTFILGLLLLMFSLLLASCEFPSSGSDPSLESTRIALGIQQTSMAMDQTRAAQEKESPVITEEAVQPTYTLYPTFTIQPVEEPEEEEEPPTEEAAMSFEEWLDEVDILLYDDMYGLGQSPVIEHAIDGLGLGSNTKNVGGAMGDLLSNLNSAMQWDLIIIAAESRDSISGDYFDVLADHIDRGTAMIFEIWYIDDINYGRILPVMQRCGISFHKDWQRNPQDNLYDFLIYLLEPSDPMFSQPNIMSMLIPSRSFLWLGDIGDTLEINAGSNAVLLAGTQPKYYDAYGTIAECLDGRMVWQTFSTHDYLDEDMIAMWQNYIYNTLLARYDYLNE